VAGSRRATWLSLMLWLSTPIALSCGHASGANDSGINLRSSGAATKPDAHTALLLVEYFTKFMTDRDLEAFRSNVSARYNEGTLGRVLSASTDVTARRAAALALGVMGNFKQSNTVLGKALGDADPGVRGMAEQALWAVWFRADSPEHNRMLGQVAQAISREQLAQAEALATRLIADAPNFAEAYNQRAIVYFLEGRFAESIRDCQQVLSRNPYHFGAISGMTEAQRRLNRSQDALDSLRRALKIQPHSEALRESIRMLEAQVRTEGGK
jgi:tetratricopeptide (TPR) repeat protein